MLIAKSTDFILKAPLRPQTTSPLTEEDLEMLRKVMKMEGLLNDKTYQHLIEE